MNDETNYTADPTLLLTAQEAATYLRIPLGSLYVHIHKKRIPCTRLGRLLRFRRVELDSIMTRSQAPAVAAQEGSMALSECPPAPGAAAAQDSLVPPRCPPAEAAAGPSSEKEN
jgi:excisionase family DNA binding protein